MSNNEQSINQVLGQYFRIWEYNTVSHTVSHSKHRNYSIQDNIWDMTTHVKLLRSLKKNYYIKKNSF